MKKTLLSFVAAAATLAAGAATLTDATQVPLLQADQLNAQKAPAGLVQKLAKQTLASRAPKKLNTPVTVASDLEGGYTWNYEMANSRATDPTTVTGTAYTDEVIIYGADDAAGTVKIAGMFDAAITGKLDLTSYSVPTVTLDTETDVAYAAISVSGASVNLTCNINGVFYYEGDDTYPANWYLTDPTLFILEDGEMLWATDVWIFRQISTILTEGDYDQYVGYTLNPQWKPGSTFTENDTNNGVMEYFYTNMNLNLASVLNITESDDYVLTVNNFAGFSANPVNFTLSNDYTWVADHPVLMSNTNGDFVLYGINGNSLVDLTGTGEGNVLTAGMVWTGYDTSTNYWLGQRNAFTITKIGEDIVWPPVLPESITLNVTEQDIVLAPGEYFQFEATVLPDNTTDKTVTWASSNEDLVTIDENGLATAVGEATAIRRAPAEDGYEFTAVEITATSVALPNLVATATVYVKNVVLPESLTIEAGEEDIILEPGDEIQLTATVLPENALDKTVTWTSSDEGLATVDENGIVTAVGEPAGLRRAPVQEGYDFTEVLISAECAANPDAADQVIVYIKTKAPVTAVTDVKAAPASVKYVNAQGQVSSVPFEGVNVVITTAADGTTTATKVVR